MDSPSPMAPDAAASAAADASTDTSAETTPRRRFSRFDRLVALTVLGLLAAFALLVWRGDRVGIPLDQITPAADAENVSTQTTVQITFSQPVAADEALTPTITPSMAGSWQWQENGLVFRPDVAWQPNTTYAVTIPAGLTSSGGRQLLAPFTWQFTTGRPEIVYLAWDETDRNQIYVAPTTGDGAPRQLTNEAHGVLDFTVALDGSTIAYTAVHEEIGSDLWLVDRDGNGRRQLLACGEEAACSKPVWSPDGARIIYERRTYTLPDAPPGPPRLWWLDVATGATVAVFQDSQWLGLGARFSPDGRWLSYISPQSQEIQAYNLETGRSVLLPSKTGEPAAWNPMGEDLLLTEIDFQGERFAVHIFHADLEAVALTDLSGEGADVNDGLPVWSPDGAWIAFGRKVPRVPMGKQIWLMRPDGSEATALTEDADVHHGSLAWSPDGRYLTFQRFVLSEPGSEPAVWVLAVESGEMWPVAELGIQPAWLP